MKKLLAMTLALALCLGLCVPALAEEADGAFYVEGQPVEAVPISDEIPVEGDDYDWDDYDWDVIWDDDDDDEPQEEPTLTLMVNGVASDATVTAVDGVSYVDAAALRAILGDKAVAPGVTGPVAVRPAAQAAGWDVEWHSNGWRKVYHEIQLWDKASFEAQLAEEFGPLNDFMARLMTVSRDVLTTKEAVSGKETVDVTLTRFSTLDGSKDYKLKFTVDYVVQNAVIDMTVTFDVAQLLQLVPPAVLAQLGKDGAPTLEQLTGLLKVGKMEFLLDYDRGVLAYNVPLLGLIGEDMAGWQTQYLDGWDEVKAALMGDEKIAVTSTLYASMVSNATRSWIGAEEALAQYQATVEAMTVFFGKDRFTTSAGGEITYSLTTQAVNRALGQLVELPEPDTASFFKACDITYSLGVRGGVNMKMHVRPDVEGIAAVQAATWGEDDYFTAVSSALAGAVTGAFDMDLTASGISDKTGGASQLSVHWNNVGKLEMKCESKAGAATRTPRRIEDVERAWVYRPVGGDPGGLFTLVGALAK